MFSVNVLFYGDYPAVAARCLRGFAALDPAHVGEVRVGLNAVSAATRTLVREAFAAAPVPVLVYEEATGANVLKYPLMRRMFYDPAHPIPGRVTHVMWFDDDSYVTDTAGFWRACAAEVARHDPAVMGSLYSPGYVWSPAERAAITAQPWFGGVPLHRKPQFATGGWWVAGLEFLSRLDYPVRELQHNGGDVLLGEMVRQGGHKLHHYRAGVAINADDAGRESGAARRGATTRRPFEAGAAGYADHHKFEVRVTRADGGR